MECKKGAQDWCQLSFSDDSSAGIRAWFNLDTGVIGSTGTEFYSGGSWTSVSHSIVSKGNGWYECSLTATSKNLSWLRNIVYAATGDLVTNYNGTIAIDAIYVAKANLTKTAAKVPHTPIVALALLDIFGVTRSPTRGLAYKVQDLDAGIARPIYSAALFAMGYSATEVEDDSTLNFGTGDFTIQYYLRTSAALVNERLVGKFDFAAQTFGWSVGMTSSGELFGWIADAADVGGSLGSVVVNDGRVHCLTIVFDRSGANEIRGYVEEVLASTPIDISSVTGSVDNTEKFIVDEGGFADSIPAEVTMVKAWSRALPASEIADTIKGIYNKTGLVVSLSYLEGAGIVVADDSGNGNDGEIKSTDGTDWGDAGIIDGRAIRLRDKAVPVDGHYVGKTVTLSNGVTRRITGYDGANRIAFVNEFWPAEYVELFGDQSNYLDTPDNALISVADDIDIRAKVALDDWTPAAEQGLVAKWITTGNERSYLFTVDVGGDLTLYVSNDGTAEISATSSVIVGVADDTTKWVRVTWSQSGSTAKFYTSDDGESWSQLGSDQTLTAAGIFDSTSPLQIGAYGTAGTAIPMFGRVYYADVRDGIDGTIVGGFDPQDTKVEEAVSDSGVTGVRWGITWQIESTDKGLLNESLLNEFILGGSILNGPLWEDFDDRSVTFQLAAWNYKTGQMEVKFSKSIVGPLAIRLPGGYKSHLFQPRLSGNLEITGLKIAESIQELKRV